MTKMTMGIGYEIYTEIDALYPGFTIRFVESIEKQRRYMIYQKRADPGDDTL